MRDGPVLRVVKAVALGVGLLEVQWRRLLLRFRGQPKYRLQGSCNGCGKCCEAPTMQAGFATWRLPRVRALALWWQRRVNGFELVDIDKRFKLFVFRCTHYDPKTRLCDSYSSRPLMCRDYPKNLLFEPLPQLFPECSHSVVLKKADAFKAALQKTGLPPDELKALEEKLMLRERAPGGDDSKEK